MPFNKSASSPALLIALASLAACGVTREGPAAGSSSLATTGSAMDQDPAASSKPAADVPVGILSAMRADAATRTGKHVDDVKVVSAEAVTWRDASLGCPQPGMMSAQVLTPGYRVKLRVGGQELTYHSAKAGTFVLCPAERAQTALPPQG